MIDAVRVAHTAEGKKNYIRSYIWKDLARCDRQIVPWMSFQQICVIPRPKLNEMLELKHFHFRPQESLLS